MRMYLTIAWRNLWRNPWRTWILTSSIAIGVVSIIGTKSFFNAFIEQRISSTLDLQSAPIYIVGEAYNGTPSLNTLIEDPSLIEQKIVSSRPELLISQKVLIPALLAHGEKNAEVSVHGVDPDIESAHTSIVTAIQSGSFSDMSQMDNGVTIGGRLARALNVDLADTIELITNNRQNEIVVDSFVVVAIFKSVNSEFERKGAFVNKSAIQRQVGLQTEITHFLVRDAANTSLHGEVDDLQQILKNTDVKVSHWEERLPLLAVSMKIFDFYILLFFIIIATAIAFSIANIFYLVVNERLQELGILGALGLTDRQIGLVFWLESFVLTQFATAIGIGLIYLILHYFAHTGVDLALFAQNLKTLGVGTMLYPMMQVKDFWLTWLIIQLIVWLASLIPLLKIRKINLSEVLP